HILTLFYSPWLGQSVDFFSFRRHAALRQRSSAFPTAIDFLNLQRRVLPLEGELRANFFNNGSDDFPSLAI
ncbi:hypothetical protein WAJ07_22395, partial [Acinetobacter baumannii]